MIEMNRTRKAPCFHASWLRIPFGSVPDTEIADRISTSYDTVRATLPRKVQATLAPRPGPT